MLDFGDTTGVMPRDSKDAIQHSTRVMSNIFAEMVQFLKIAPLLVPCTYMKAWRLQCQEVATGSNFYNGFSI
jgi:hypothetical protein